MKKIILWMFLLILLGIVTACEQASSNSEKEYLNENENEITDEFEEPKDPLSLEDIKAIVVNNIEEIENSISGLQEEYPNLFNIIDESFHEKIGQDDEIDKIVDATSKRLSGLVEDGKKEELAISYLYANFFVLEGFVLVPPTYHLTIRHEIVEQSENHFELKFLVLDDRVNYVPQGTIVTKYKKENNSWIFVDQEFINPDDKPFDLTFEDLEYYIDYQTNEIKQAEFVEEVELDGEKYIIINKGHYSQAINVKDSTINEDLTEKYTNLIIPEEITIEDFEEDVIVEKEVETEIAKAELKKLDKTLHGMGILTEEQDIQLYKLVAEGYQEFVEFMQQYHYYETEDDIMASVIEGAIPHNYTIYEAIIAFDDDGNTYAATLAEGEIVKYYTTDPMYVNEVPWEILSWKGRFSHLPVEKYYKEKN